MRVKIIFNDKNKGVAYSRNKAISIAQGEYVAFLDCDDYWETNKIEVQLNFMLTHGYDFSHTTYQVLNYNEKIVSTIKARETLKYKELLKSYFKNDEELKKYPNSRNMFAFPFGQPDSCFSNRQIELIIENGAKKVFSAYPVINSDISAPYLHRIPLDTHNNTKSRIWFNILRRSFKI